MNVYNVPRGIYNVQHCQIMFIIVLISVVFGALLILVSLLISFLHFYILLIIRILYFTLLVFTYMMTSGSRNVIVRVRKCPDVE